MMKPVPLLLLVLITMQTPVYTHSYIMGEDSRDILRSAEKTVPVIRQIGIIDTRDGGFVSGIVTGQNCDVVVSAGHAAFYWESNRLLERVKGTRRGNGELLFYPWPEQGSSSIPLRLVESGYENKELVGKDTHDWSIFRLQEPAYESCQVLEFRQATAQCGGSLIFPAYHFDYKREKLIDRSCEIKDTLEKEKLIVHDCDTKDGSSGAPLVCRTMDHYSILGINISGLTARSANNPSIFGNPGQPFNIKTHKNYAVTIHGDFYRALMKELDASEVRYKSGILTP